MLLTAAMITLAAPVWVGKFSQSGEAPAPWGLVRLGETKPTVYRQASVAGTSAIEARFDRSMALLARPIKVDLATTPILCWRWFVESVVANGDMSRKSGNDFAARVYVAFDMPNEALDAGTKFKLGVARRIFGLKVPDAAVTYVWDNSHAVGFARKSSYTNQMQLVVAQSGNAQAGIWVSERADVAADFARAFAGKPGRPTELAIASDGDNTKSKGRAAFADFHFVRRNQQCSA